MAHEADVPLAAGEYKPLFAPDLLAGKVAFITGGGSGIGFRIAEMFMRHGADIAIASRKLDRVRESAARLEAAVPGRSCLAVQLDVRNPDACKAAMLACVDRYKAVDILVNSAAGNFLSPASGLSANAFKTVMEIDAHGTFNMCKAAFDAHMQKHGGVILSITATLAYKGDALQTHAGSAKAAIDAMMRHMANEWGIHGIRCNSLAPGPIGDTEGYRRLGGFMSEAQQKKYKREAIPLGRLGTREEMANAALFLCSDAAAYTTGVVLIADGGSWFRTPKAPMPAAGFGSGKPKSKL